MQTILTERLTLRKVKSDDATQIIQQINNINVSRLMSNVPYPYTKEDAEWWIEHCLKSESNDRIHFVIIRNIDQKLIGGIDLMNLQLEHKRAQLGYWLGEDYWRMGYGFEAGQAIIQYAFQKLYLEILTLNIFVENKASRALVQKLGFQQKHRANDQLTAKSTGSKHEYDILELKMS